MDEVHELVYFGNGGFSYGDVWNMPIMTRRYHIRKIIDFLEKKREHEEKSMKGSKTMDAKAYAKQTNVPDFVSKVKKS